MACTLTESPSDPLHRKLRQLRCLRRRFDCYRVERTSSRAGVAPAEVQRLFTAHWHANLPLGNAVIGARWLSAIGDNLGNRWPSVSFLEFYFDEIVKVADKIVPA